MNGREALEVNNSGGCLYAGGDRIEFSREQVTRLGKLRIYGDAKTRYLVNLSDGHIVFVKASEQGPADERWLRKIAKDVPSPITRGKDDFVITWGAPEALKSRGAFYVA